MLSKALVCLLTLALAACASAPAEPEVASELSLQVAGFVEAEGIT